MEIEKAEGAAGPSEPELLGPPLPKAPPDDVADGLMASPRPAQLNWLSGEERVDEEEDGAERSMTPAGSRVSEQEDSGTRFAQFAWDEGRRCVLMLVGFALAVLHLYIYPAWFGVRIVGSSEVPHDERDFFHHGWTAMLVIFFVEGVTVFLKVLSTRKTKWLANAVLQK